MIHEYALEQELVASWHDRILFRYFIEQFGFGTARVVSRYPKKWRKLVWDAFEQTFGRTADETDKVRMAELLKQLTAPEIRRPECIWDDARDWLVNAEGEHERKPFHAILARANPHTNPAVICAADVLAGTPEGWKTSRSLVISRTAATMSQCLAPLLRCATRILLVDPHFRASRPKFRNPLAEFLRVVGPGPSTIAIELHAGHVADDAPPFHMFQRECEQFLPGLVPKGQNLLVRRWKNRSVGERLHNRYVLTDIGGVQFGVGLDEGDTGTTDDLTLLSTDVYRRRLEDYSGPAYAFDLEGEFRIVGQLS